MSQKKSNTPQKSNTPLKLVPPKKKRAANFKELLPEIKSGDSRKLSDRLLSNPQTSFAIEVNVEGRSVSEHIHDGDLVIVDASLTPRRGDIVLHRTNGEMRLDQFNASRDVVAVATSVVHLLRERKAS